jgi:hypothetical protein
MLKPTMSGRAVLLIIAWLLLPIVALRLLLRRVRGLLIPRLVVALLWRVLLRWISLVLRRVLVVLVVLIVRSRHCVDSGLRFVSRDVYSSLLLRCRCG